VGREVAMISDTKWRIIVKGILKSHEYICESNMMLL